MKNYIVVLALLLGVTYSVTGQVEVRDTHTDSNTSNSITSTEQSSSVVMFTGDVFGAENETVTLVVTDYGKATIVLTLGTIILNLDNRRVENNDGYDLITYDVVKANLEGMEWQEFTILDMSNMTDEAREPFTSTLSTPRNFVINITGEPKLRFFMDIQMGKL